MKISIALLAAVIAQEEDVAAEAPAAVERIVF
jgi:hypothetical protein